MMANDLSLYLIESGRKNDHAFTTLCFAALALSIQFSPGLGQSLTWMLILSWTFFLLAGAAGGWRIFRRDVFYRHNLDSNNLKALIQRRRTALGNLELDDDFEVAQDIDTGMPITAGQLRFWIRQEEEAVQDLKMHLETNQSLLIRLLWFQVASFLLAISMNLLFAAFNVLE